MFTIPSATPPSPLMPHLPPLLPRVSTSASTETLPQAMHDDASPEPAAPRRQAPLPDLPREIWGEIAHFASRDTVLNLRGTSHLLKMESDLAMTHMTLRGGARLRAFADADAFPHVQTLKLIRCGDADLVYLGASLTRYCRPQLVLELDHSNAGITWQGFAALQTAMFRSLHMRYGVLDTTDVHALSGLRCDLSITAYSEPDSLLAMAGIRGLRKLWPIRSVFDAHVALAFRDHPLTELTLVSARLVSSAALQHLAENRALRTLDLDSAEAFFDVDAARAFAANQTLETLAVWHPMHHFLTENACAALSENRSLKVLAIPVPAGVRYLGRMGSLETLHLQGLTEGARQAVPVIEEQDAHALVQGLQLQSLQLSQVTFRPSALAILLGGIRANQLCLTDVMLDTRAVAALLTNRHVAALELVTVQIDSADVIALGSHPSLARFSMRTPEGEPDEQLPLTAIQALWAAWEARGRSRSQLAGVLAQD